MKIYVGKSKLHGKGIFAKRNIKKGETIFVVEGKKVKFLISDEKKAKVAGLNWVGYGKNTWINPIRSSVRLNHSCDPNAFVRGRKKIAARKNIKKGEEVLIDYSLNEGDIFWSMKCNCGTKNCRKNIKSIQFLPKTFYLKSKAYIPKYYKKVFDKFNEKNFKNPVDFRTTWVHFLKRDFVVK